MKSYGMEMYGKFSLQKIQSLPLWTTYDEGRLVYVVDDDIYYIGGISDWIILIKGILNKKPTLASSILVDSEFGYFDPMIALNVLLDGLVNGQAIRNKSFTSRHYANNSILPVHIKLGFANDAFNAIHLPCKDITLSVETPTNSTVQAVLNSIITRTSSVITKKIQLTTWVYDVASELYIIIIPYHTLHKEFANVQCFDEQGILFTPEQVRIDPNTREVSINSPFRRVMTVVIIG